MNKNRLNEKSLSLNDVRRALNSAKRETIKHVLMALKPHESERVIELIEYMASRVEKRILSVERGSIKRKNSKSKKTKPKDNHLKWRPIRN